MCDLSAQRPKPALRERALVHGLEHMGDAELLALLIGTGSDGETALGVATKLLQAKDELEGVSKLGGHALSSFFGIGPAKASRILAAFELGKRATLRSLSEEFPVVASFDDVVAWAHPRLAGLDHEEVWLLSLDGRNGLRAARRVAQGGLHGCALTPRDILRPALRHAASALILLHNHPSGDPTPSDDDVRMTRAVAAACDVVGIPLLDHVVVARSGSTSLRDLGILGA